MRILILSELFPPHIGGCEQRMFELSSRLAKLGHSVDVLTIKFSKELSDVEFIDGVRVLRISRCYRYTLSHIYRNPLGVLSYFVDVARFLLKHDGYDVIYSNEWPLLHTLITYELTEAPIVQDWAEIWESLPIKLLQKLIASLDVFHVAVSRLTANRLIRWLGAPPSRVFIVPNGIDFSKFSEIKAEKEKGTIVFVGRLVRHKRVDLLLRAFIKAKRKVRNLKLKLVGSGYLLDRLKQLKIEGIEFLGAVDEQKKLEVLSKAWLFVMPSEREGFGIAALEAMACGTPVITTDFPDNATKELAKEAGLPVVLPTAEAIAEKIVEIYQNEDSYWEMSKKAKEFARKFDWNLIAKKLEAVLQKATRGSS